VPVGGKLILGRNSHHSAFSALRLGGINPVYVRPKTDPRTGLVGEMLPSELRAACEANPDASAVLVASPNYYGMLSDISALASVAHEYSMILIVDQAHGAHLRFFDRDADSLAESGIRIPFPKHSAESLGADIVINSTHKTLLSFTGSGIMNICTDSVDIPSVSDALRMIQTTSPSYILMASLDINERIMRQYGDRIIRAWREDLTTFYRRVLRIPGLDIAGLRPEDIEMVSTRAAASSDADKPEAAPQETVCSFPMYFSRAGLDMTKINISMASAGISGARLEKELRTRGIIAEMVHGDYVMLMTGAGNRTADYSKLLDVLWDLSDNYGVVDKTSRVHRHDPRTVDDFRLDVTTVPFGHSSSPCS
jgi:lysine decarboxylase